MRECYPHGLRFCNECRSAPENVHFQGVKKGAAVLLTEELFFHDHDALKPPFLFCAKCQVLLTYVCGVLTLPVFINSRWRGIFSLWRPKQLFFSRRRQNKWMSLFIKVNSTFIGGDSTLWQKLVMDKIMVLVMAEKNYYTALSRRRFVVYLT